jgi:hypothetical protein
MAFSRGRVRHQLAGFHPARATHPGLLGRATPPHRRCCGRVVSRPCHGAGRTPELQRYRLGCSVSCCGSSGMCSAVGASGERSGGSAPKGRTAAVLLPGTGRAHPQTQGQRPHCARSRTCSMPRVCRLLRGGSTGGSPPSTAFSKRSTCGHWSRRPVGVE